MSGYVAHDSISSIGILHCAQSSKTRALGKGPRRHTLKRISASVESEASLEEVKKYCCDRSSTARRGGTTAVARPVASCRFRFLHDLMTAM